MIGVGPFSIQVVIVALAALAAWLLARVTAKRFVPDKPYKAAGSLILDALFWGLLSARLGYIAQWWREYSAAPMSMLAIGDGGFSWWVGILAGVAYLWWRTRGRRALRRSLFAGTLAGLAVWFAAGVALEQMQRSAPGLPQLQLTTLDGQPINLAAYKGRPVVLNLWASWCPPCRREMPVFEQAQKTFPDMAFVMVNQGETAQQAGNFLRRQGLALTDVLLDSSSQAMKAMGSRGLPTTLFFDAQGRLVDSHVGELTMAGLKGIVSRRFSNIER